MLIKIVFSDVPEVIRGVSKVCGNKDNIQQFSGFVVNLGGEKKELFSPIKEMRYESFESVLIDTSADAETFLRGDALSATAQGEEILEYKFAKALQ